MAKLPIGWESIYILPAKNEAQRMMYKREDWLISENQFQELHFTNISELLFWACVELWRMLKSFGGYLCKVLESMTLLQLAVYIMGVLVRTARYPPETLLIVNRIKTTLAYD